MYYIAVKTPVIRDALLRAKADGVREALRTLERVNDHAFQQRGFEALLQELATRIEKGEPT